MQKDAWETVLPTDMKKNFFYLSFLRVVGCVAVVVLHLAASETLIYQNVLTGSQMFGMTLVYNLMMWAVPVFVMVSGALLLDPEKDITIRKIFTSYIKRILIALVSFSLVFRIFDMVMDHEAFTVSGILKGLLNAFTGNGWSHMWYLYLIIGLYLILPALRAVTKSCLVKELKYLLIVGFVVISVLPLTRLFGISSSFYIHVNTIYPVYFLLGYMLHKDIIRIDRRVAAALMVIGAAGIVCGTYFGLKGSIQNPTVLTGYASPFVAFLASGIFFLSKDIKEPTEKMKSIVLSIDRCSFGIYLIHMVFVRLLLRYLQVNLFDYPIWLSVPISAVFIFSVSLVLVYVYCRIIPDSKYIDHSQSN